VTAAWTKASAFLGPSEIPVVPQGAPATFAVMPRNAVIAFVFRVKPVLLTPARAAAMTPMNALPEPKLLPAERAGLHAKPAPMARPASTNAAPRAVARTIAGAAAT